MHHNRCYGIYGIMSNVYQWDTRGLLEEDVTNLYFLLSWGLIGKYHFNIKPIAWMICHCGKYKTRLRWQSSSDDDGKINADVSRNQLITYLGRLGVISLRVIGRWPDFPKDLKELSIESEICKSDVSKCLTWIVPRNLTVQSEQYLKDNTSDQIVIARITSENNKSVATWAQNQNYIKLYLDALTTVLDLTLK